MKKNTCMDYLIQGEIVIIGAAETAHLASIVLKWPFSRCVMLFLVLAAAVCVLTAALFLRKKGYFLRQSKEQKEKERYSISERLLLLLLALSFMAQLFYLCMGQNHYRQGDMTVETVTGFLAADGIYQVNPLTGRPFAEGIPMRLKILCLPTLYGSLCRIFGLSPKAVVWNIMPVVTLVSSYAAFASLGRCLFPKEACRPFSRANRKQRLCFLIMVSLLFWSGTYLDSMDGFQLLHCGWRGTAIRNCVLMPWLLSLCLRKKWFGAVLCILAEVCMVWTLYGMGICLMTAVGMAAAGLLCRKFSGLEPPAAEAAFAPEKKEDAK